MVMQILRYVSDEAISNCESRVVSVPLGFFDDRFKAVIDGLAVARIHPLGLPPVVAIASRPHALLV
jgi:hypothetical protein